MIGYGIGLNDGDTLVWLIDNKKKVPPVGRGSATYLPLRYDNQTKKKEENDRPRSWDKFIDNTWTYTETMTMMMTMKMTMAMAMAITIMKKKRNTMEAIIQQHERIHVYWLL